MHIDDIDKEFRELGDSIKLSEEALSRGDLAQAEPLCKKALQLVKNSYGEHDPETARCVQNLADVYYQLHRYNESVPLLSRLASIRAQTLGKNSPDVAATLFKLARSYEKLGQIAEADSVYQRMMSFVESSPSSDRAFAASILESYARFLSKFQNKSEEAAELEMKARELLGQSKAKLAGNILKQMGTGEEFAEEVAKAQEALLAQESTSPGLRSLRSRLGRGHDQIEDDRSKLAAKASPMLVFFTLLFLAMTATGVLLFLQSQTAKLTGPPKAAEQPPPKPAFIPQTYMTVDSVEQLRLLDETHAVFSSGGKVFKGTYTLTASELTLKGDKGRELRRFQQLEGGFGQKNGVMLYNSTAPEMEIVRIMKSMAASSISMFRTRRTYPSAMTNYQNPYSGDVESVRVQLLLPTQQKTMSLTDYDSQQDEASKMILWTNKSSGHAGYIDVVNSVESRAGNSLYIRGTDRNGVYLQSSQPGRTFMINVVEGQLSY